MTNKDDTLSLVEQLLSNESPTNKEGGRTKTYKKAKKTSVMDAELNKGFDPDAVQEYWQGDLLKMNKDMLRRTRLGNECYLVVTQTPSFFRQASVYCPWYKISGWGDTTIKAMEACVNNVASYWENYPEAAAELLLNYDGRAESLKTLADDANKSAAKILEEEGL